MAHEWHAALILSVYIFYVRLWPSTFWHINVSSIIHANVFYSVINADVNICTSYTSYNLQSTWICYSAVAWHVYWGIYNVPLYHAFQVMAHSHDSLSRSTVPRENQSTVPRTQVSVWTMLKNLQPSWLNGDISLMIVRHKRPITHHVYVWGLHFVDIM